MSTKASIYYDKGTDTHLFEEVSMCDDFKSPAYIQCKWFKIDIEAFETSPRINSVTLEIPETVMDRLSIEWCKKRKLHNYLDEPISKSDVD